MVRLSLSTIPSDCGWRAVVLVFWIPNSSHISENTADSKFRPWSEWSDSGAVSYTHSDAADEEDSVDLGGRRIIKKKNTDQHSVITEQFVKQTSR